MSRRGVVVTVAAVLAAGAGVTAAGQSPASDVVVVENNKAPWPAGSGEQPPPVGGVVLVDGITGERRRIATGLIDPVWAAVDVTQRAAYIGLFHPGQIVKVPLDGGAVVTVARGLSCPEGVGVDTAGRLYVVENPVGNECRGRNLTKAAHLTRVDTATGTLTELAELQSPHGLAVQGETAYVCEWGAHALTAVNLTTGAKRKVAPLASPSGCAVGAGAAYAVEQGDTDGQLVQVELRSGLVTVLLDSLVGPMGVAADPSAGLVYVGERHKNEVLRVNLATNTSMVFSRSDTAPFNSPIGLACV